MIQLQIVNLLNFVLKVFKDKNICFLTVNCVLVLCVSCSYKQEVPANWIQENNTNTKDVCIISGDYINKGESPNNKSFCYKSLAYLLFYQDKEFSKNDRKQYLLRTMDKVSIEQEGIEKIKISAFKDNQLIVKKTFFKEKGDFICKNGMITISYIESFGEAFFVGPDLLKSVFIKKMKT